MFRFFSGNSNIFESNGKYIEETNFDALASENEGTCILPKLLVVKNTE